MAQGRKDPQAGEKLFNALRELEIQFLNGGYSVQTSAQGLLSSHDFTPAKMMAKYLIEQSILKRDEKNSTHKKPYYWYNGPKLTVKYCNELITAMRLDRSSRERPKNMFTYESVLTNELALISEELNDFQEEYKNLMADLERCHKEIQKREPVKAWLEEKLKTQSK